MSDKGANAITVNDLVALLVELAAVVILCLWGFRTGSHVTTSLLLGLGVPAVAIAAWALFAAPRSAYDVRALEIAVKVLVLGGAALASFTLIPTGLAIAFAAIVAVNTTLVYVGPFAR